MLRVTEDRNDISGRWYNDWLLNTWMDSPIFRWLRETLLPMNVKVPAEYPAPDQNDKSREALLPEQDPNQNAFTCTPTLQKAVVFCPLPGQLRDLKLWVMMFFVDNVDIFYMFAEIGNDDCTEMQLKFQDLRNPSLFVTTPKVGGTRLNLSAVNVAEISQKLWVCNEQWQAFAQVVGPGQN